MTGVTIAAIVTLVLACYLASLTLALHRTRRSRLASRCDAMNREHVAEWFAEHRRDAAMCLTLFRTAARLAVAVLVLLHFTGIGEGSHVSVQSMIVGGGIAAIALWLGTSVVAIPIANHAGVALIIRSLPVLRVAALIGRPMSYGLFFIDESIRRLSGANLETQNGAEEELLRSIEESQLEGDLEPEAAEMLENVVEFRDSEVSEVMTPRTDIDGIEYTDDITEIRMFIERAGHSRIPVYRENLDRIDGILYVKDLVPYLGTDASTFVLHDILRRPIVVPETKSVPELLRDFQTSEVHMAIVIDEYGGTAGLVTIEDVIEEIVGEIHDEHEPEDEELPALNELDATHAEVDGRFHIDDLNERLDLSLPEDDDYETVAGFMLAKLGRVPEIGDSFEAFNVRFTTIEATDTHIQKVAIELLDPAVNGQDPA